MVRAAAIVLALAGGPGRACGPLPAAGRDDRRGGVREAAHGADPVRLEGVHVRGKVKLGHANVPDQLPWLLVQHARAPRRRRSTACSISRGLRSLASFDATGAEFKQPVLLGREGRLRRDRARQLLLRHLRRLGRLRGTSFGLANLGQARFRGPVGFGHASFVRPVSFAGRDLRGRRRFDDAWFARPASFLGRPSAPGAFPADDLRSVSHASRPIDDGAPTSPRRPSPVRPSSHEPFCGEATFQRTRFDGGASFVGAQFLIPAPPPKSRERAVRRRPAPRRRATATIRRTSRSRSTTPRRAVASTSAASSSPARRSSSQCLRAHALVRGCLVRPLRRRSSSAGSSRSRTCGSRRRLPERSRTSNARIQVLRRSARARPRATTSRWRTTPTTGAA